MREIDWGHFRREDCLGCDHWLRRQRGVACPDCEAMGEALVEGFLLAATEAVTLARDFGVLSGWHVQAPGGWYWTGEHWSKTSRVLFGSDEAAESALGAARASLAGEQAFSWWPLQPWEVEA